MKSLIRFLLSQHIDPELSVLLATIIAAALAMLCIVVVAVLIKQILLRFINRLASKTSTSFDDILVSHSVFAGVGRLVPPILIHLLAAPVFSYYPDIIDAVNGFAALYMIIGVVIVIFSLLEALSEYFIEFSTISRVPVKSIVQVIKSLAVSIGVIIVVSRLMGKSPVVFLSGIGAFTAVLLLIFKNSLLGFMAGIQLSTNNLVRVGDWIDMPKYEADGEVTDISLVTVSVQNWDKTISTIPSFALISEGFKNWRGMNESGGRRIKRSINIDMNSIQFCDDAMLARLDKIELLRNYLIKKTEDVAAYNRLNMIDDSTAVNGRRLTNLGTFSAYLSEYLRHHPKVNASMRLIIRYLQPTANGMPLEILVFSIEKEWAHYELVQSDIIDHILAILPYFGLRVFQNPGSYDIRQSAKTQEQSHPE